MTYPPGRAVEQDRCAGFNRHFFDLLNHAVEVGVTRGNAGFEEIEGLLAFLGKAAGDGVITA